MHVNLLANIILYISDRAELSLYKIKKKKMLFACT